jgi:hypothetical protein
MQCQSQNSCKSGQCDRKGSDYMIHPQTDEGQIYSRPESYDSGVSSSSFAELGQAYSLPQSSPLHKSQPTFSGSAMYSAQHADQYSAQMDAEPIMSQDEIYDKTIANMVDEIVPEMNERLPYPENRTARYNPAVLKSNLLEGFHVPMYQQNIPTPNDIARKMNSHKSIGMTLIFLIVLIALAFYAYNYMGSNNTGDLIVSTPSSGRIQIPAVIVN